MHSTTCSGRADRSEGFRRAADRTDVLQALFRRQGGASTFPRNRTLVCEGAPIDRVYRIESGFVRCCSYTEDGLRQIFAFAGPGDLLGFPDLDTWHFTAEAVDRVTVRWVRAETLDAALLGEPPIARALRRRCVCEFERRERHLMWLSWLQSEERLLAFLEEFAERADRDEGLAVLPMTRQDLGDYLGMTLETVSRCFGTLRRGGAIAMRGANRYRLLTGRDLAPHPRAAA